MRAAVLRELGGTPAAEEFDDPSGHEDGELVDVTVAGLNPVDVFIASGKMPRVKPEVPSVLGLEGVGTVSDSGRRVYFSATVAPYGSLAERTVAERETLIDVPDGVDDAVAVAFGIAGMAGWIAPEWRAGLRAGETVLVLGASGVVGQIATQAAKLLGAGRVIAAARDEGALARLAELGADETVAIGDDPAAFTEALLEASGGGVDLIVDPVWGAPAAAALGAVARDGRLVQVGNAAGPTSEFAVGGLRNAHATIIGYTNFNVPEEVKADAFRRMCEHAARGELTVEVEEVPLAEVADAWERQQDGPHRKLVVRP
jgi:NADPH2:quinone reductase